VLVVTEKLIAERPAVVRDLVRGIAESGEWAETHRVDAARLVSPYFRQDRSSFNTSSRNLRIASATGC